MSVNQFLSEHQALAAVALVVNAKPTPGHDDTGEFGHPGAYLSRIHWDQSVHVYLHRDPVDFRQAINGLSVIVTEAMALSPFDKALFVFCNRRRTQLKVLYWDETGFALWQKRLEQETFKWPRHAETETLRITTEQWQWLLRGFDVTQLKSHQRLFFDAVN